MKTRTVLLSGIALLALAAAPAAAQSTPDTTPAPQTQTAPDQSTPDAGQTGDSTAPGSEHTARHHHKRIDKSDESTPQEVAETERLNQQQLQQPGDTSQQTAAPAPMQSSNGVQPGSEPTTPPTDSAAPPTNSPGNTGGQ
jgi:hypothetical protein